MHLRTLRGIAGRVPVSCRMLTLVVNKDTSFHPSIHAFIQSSTCPYKSNHPSIQIQPVIQQTIQLPIKQSIQQLLSKKTNHLFIHPSNHPSPLKPTIHPASHPLTRHPQSKSSVTPLFNHLTFNSLIHVILTLAYTTCQVLC